ncbi:hypothetical protein Pam4_07 [Pseudanabaena phage Pam4]|nr:hypothetical protein Pam4_07 [Pseudanabaena phage Pam4]
MTTRTGTWVCVRLPHAWTGKGADAKVAYQVRQGKTPQPLRHYYTRAR